MKAALASETDETDATSRGLRRAVLVGALLLFAGVLIAHAILIGAASWRPDEFDDFTAFRDHGWSAFLSRLTTWSPRPLSESLIGLYFLAQQWLRRPLIEPFLGALWTTLLLGPALFVWRGWRGERRLQRLALAGGVLCLCLLGHRLAEVFYWPLGAAAYVPVLAAAVAVTLEAVDGRWERAGPRYLGILVLLAAAASAELGAILAILVAVPVLATLAARRLGSRVEWGCWALLVAFACGVMAMLALGRGQLLETLSYGGATPSPKLQSHVVASLLRSIPTTLRQLIVLDGDQAGVASFAWGLVVKGVVLFGFAALLADRAAPPLSRTGRALAGALLLGFLLTFAVSIAGSNYKFGLVCCERHDTIRQGLAALSLLLAAGLLAAPLRRLLSLLPAPLARGPAILALAVAALLVQRLPDLSRDYALRPSLIKSRREIWRSGMAPGPTLIVPTTAVPPLVGGWIGPADATLSRGPATPWPWQRMLDFFGKNAIVLLPPRR